MPEERIYPVVTQSAWDSLTDDEKKETAICGLGPVLNRVRYEGRFTGDIYTLIPESRGGAAEAKRQKDQSGRNGPVQSYIPDTTYVRPQAFGTDNRPARGPRAALPLTFGLEEALRARRLGEQITMTEMTMEEVLALPFEEQIAAIEKIKAAKIALANKPAILNIPEVDLNLLCPHCQKNDKRNVTQNSNLGKQYYCKNCTSVWSVNGEGAHYINQTLHPHTCEV